MIAMRHAGIYVDDISRLEDFYSSVFQMVSICSQEPDSGVIFDELIGAENVSIMTTKLITPYGKLSAQGDMVELVKVITPLCQQQTLQKDHPIYLTGIGHIAFGVDNINETVLKIIEKSGCKKTNITDMPNGNKCCFCTDPEGNWIELIQRKE